MGTIAPYFEAIIRATEVILEIVRGLFWSYKGLSGGAVGALHANPRSIHL